jgi:hypothetical protein
MHRPRTPLASRGMSRPCRVAGSRAADQQPARPSKPDASDIVRARDCRQVVCSRRRAPTGDDRETRAKAAHTARVVFYPCRLSSQASKSRASSSSRSCVLGHHRSPGLRAGRSGHGGQRSRDQPSRCSTRRSPPTTPPRRRRISGAYRWLALVSHPNPWPCRQWFSRRRGGVWLSGPCPARGGRRRLMSVRVRARAALERTSTNSSPKLVTMVRM